MLTVDFEENYWDLALAREIARAGQATHNTDVETGTAVPKLIGVAAIEINPKGYGVTIAAISGMLDHRESDR